MTLNRRDVLGGATALVAMATTGARAQTYPSKPIRCIVPYAPGGNVDVTGRLIADPMTKMLGQPVIVENRAGAGGLVGAEATVQAPADGYTFVIGAFGTFHIAALMAGKPSMMPYFAPVSLLTYVPMVVVAAPNGRFKDWPSVMAHAKANPGTISIGHAGNGTTNHIGILRVQVAENVKFNIVPYRGSGQGLNDVLANQIDLYVDQLSSSLPHIKSGKLKPLATMSLDPIAELPGVPTLKQLGGPAFDGGTTLGVFVRNETAKPIIDTLNKAIVAALKDAAVTKRLGELGVSVMPSTPAEYAERLKQDERDTLELEKLGFLKPE
jgi:tripartite-type tricarboxylate transporter receptor subunit TctC